MLNRRTEQPFCKKRVRCSLISGFQDTRTNGEDFALTPYLFGVWVTGEIIKVRGFGICWGYYSVFLGLGWNLPKSYPSFKVLSKNKKQKNMWTLRILKEPVKYQTIGGFLFRLFGVSKRSEHERVD